MSQAEPGRRDAVRGFILKQIQRKARLPADADLAVFDYIDSGHVDSIGIIKFVLEIEAEFDVTIDDAELASDRFRTVEGVIALVEGKLA